MKVARSTREYKDPKPSYRRATSKKSAFSPGMVVTVTNKDDPNFGSLVEIVEIEDIVVTCKTYDREFIGYLTIDLSSKLDPEESLRISLEIAERRIKSLEKLIEKFICVSQQGERPSQMLIEKAEF